MFIAFINVLCLHLRFAVWRFVFRFLIRLRNCVYLIPYKLISHNLCARYRILKLVLSTLVYYSHSFALFRAQFYFYLFCCWCFSFKNDTSWKKGKPTHNHKLTPTPEISPIRLEIWTLKLENWIENRLLNDNIGSGINKNSNNNE